MAAPQNAGLPIVAFVLIAWRRNPTQDSNTLFFCRWILAQQSDRPKCHWLLYSFPAFGNQPCENVHQVWTGIPGPRGQRRRGLSGGRRDDLFPQRGADLFWQRMQDSLHKIRFLLRRLKLFSTWNFREGRKKWTCSKDSKETKLLPPHTHTKILTYVSRTINWDWGRVGILEA